MRRVASVVSERYAVSLYEIACGEKLEEQILGELTAIRDVFAQNQNYLKILTAPSILFTTKKNSLREAFEGRVHEYVLNFLMLLTEKRRISAFAEIVQAYKDSYYWEQGICEVTATTASEMDAAQQTALTKKMEAVTGKKILLTNVVEASIVGGIKIRLENRQIDSTVGTRLAEIARQINSTNA